jgi:hypothetical protein
MSASWAESEHVICSLLAVARVDSLAAMLRSARLRFRRQRIAYYVCGVAIVLGCGAYYRQLWPDYTSFAHYIDPKCQAQYCDFTYFYYTQAQSILTDDTPVKKYYYSATFALLLVPIGHLPLDAALSAWTWVQAVSLVLLILASVLLLRGFPRWTHALVLFLTLTSYPMLNNWKWGQANTTFMALIVLALALGERGRSKLAALSLSLVVASRYYPIIYALAFLARRRMKALVWLVVFVVLLVAVLPVLAMGYEHAWNFYTRSAASIDAALPYIAKSRGSEYLPTTALRLARLWEHEATWSHEVWAGIAAALATCNAVTALWAGYKRITHRTLWCFCFSALSTPLIAPTSWTHYFVYLPLVHTFIGAQLTSLRCHWLLRAGLLFIWIPSVAVATVFFAHSGGAAYAERGYLLLSNLALLALAYGLVGLSVARVGGVAVRGRSGIGESSQVRPASC